MPFTRPTLETIIDRVKGDIKNTLGLTTILRRSTEDAFAKALSGVAHSLHGHMRFISKQIFPNQAEQTYLETWASIYGLDRLSATFAQFTLDGTGTAGAVIPAGTEFERSDGEIYTTNAEVTLSTSTYTVTVTAQNSGSTPNTDVGSVLSLVSPVTNVDTDATVGTIVTEADDAESDDNLRSRLLQRIQNPPSGGTANDYIGYMTGVAGVTRAWVLPGLVGEGTVGCTFVEDGEPNIIPQQAKIDEVAAAILENAPVTAEVYTFAPEAFTVNFEIELSPDTTAVRTAVENEIKDLIRRESQVAGSYKEVGSNYSGILPISKIREAVSIAAGENDNRVTSPINDVVPSQSQIIVPGTFTFSELF